MSIDTSKPWPRPTPQQVWAAVDVYLRAAYPGEPPSAIRARMETLHSMPPEEFYESSVFEKDAVAYPPRYRLRLGNCFYPHMKLVIDRAPDGRGHLFRADTHDDHCCPEPGSRDFSELIDLMEKNRDISRQVESAWEKKGIPTFRTYLKADLARRTAASPAPASVSPAAPRPAKAPRPHRHR
ncbi:MAG: hypothetical protein ABSH20_01735 [Tepidisphaeraceae bacterium]